jgi:hypothetical protein
MGLLSAGENSRLVAEGGAGEFEVMIGVSAIKNAQAQSDDLIGAFASKM